MLRLRRTHPALRDGDVVLPEEAHSKILTYRRTSMQASVRVVVNLTRSTVDWPLPQEERVGVVLVTSGTSSTAVLGTVRLGPYSGVMVELEPS
jgi:hypothetical protein